MITKICVPNFPIKRRASLRHDVLPAIRGNATSCAPWSDNRDCSKSTKIFACAMPPIARAVRYRSNCGDGKNIVLILLPCRYGALFCHFERKPRNPQLLMRIKSEMSRPIPGRVLRNVGKDGKQGKKKAMKMT